MSTATEPRSLVVLTKPFIPAFAAGAKARVTQTIADGHQGTLNGTFLTELAHQLGIIYQGATLLTEAQMKDRFRVAFDTAAKIARGGPDSKEPLKSDEMPVTMFDNFR